jgi:hypothetical protein
MEKEKVKIRNWSKYFSEHMPIMGFFQKSPFLMLMSVCMEREC